MVEDLLEKNVVKLAYSANPPIHRVIRPGVSIEGVCNNSKCSLYEKRIWFSKGFEELDLGM